MPNATGLSLAVVSYTLLSAGFVLMKKGIAWMGHKGPKDRIWSGRLTIWIAGFLLSNLSIVPNAMALDSLEPHIVAALGGWGVIVLVLLSRLILGEKLYLSDAVYTAFICLAILLLNFFERPGFDAAVNVLLLTGVAFLPLLFMAAAVIRIFSAPSRALLFALTAGSSTGLIVILMKILVRYYGFRLSAYFQSPYFYLYLFFSIVAFAAIQLAYRLEAMMRIGPLQYASSIIYPVICSVLVFGVRLHPAQILAILALAFSSAEILRRR